MPAYRGRLSVVALDNGTIGVEANPQGFFIAHEEAVQVAAAVFSFAKKRDCPAAVFDPDRHYETAMDELPSLYKDQFWKEIWRELEMPFSPVVLEKEGALYVALLPAKRSGGAFKGSVTPQIDYRKARIKLDRGGEYTNENVGELLSKMEQFARQTSYSMDIFVPQGVRQGDLKPVILANKYGQPYMAMLPSNENKLA